MNLEREICKWFQKTNVKKEGILGFPTTWVTNFNWGHYFWGLIWGQF